MLLSLASCGDEFSFFYEAFESEDATETEPIVQDYIIKVVTEGGMALEDITVMVYEDSKKDSLVNAGTTDEDGFFSFAAYRSENYVAVLSSGLSEGYIAENEYPIRSKDNEFVVKTALTGDTVRGAELSLGDIAFDFEITDANGAPHKASEILKTKKAIVLNFWFENCGPCKMEFPYMQAAYEGYSDKLEILALNPLDGTQSSVKKYAESLSITFPMASVGDEWQTSVKGLSGYPTTVIIDRYGMVVFMHMGAITNKETFEKVFAYFTADDYVQKTVRNLSDIK